MCCLITGHYQISHIRHVAGGGNGGNRVAKRNPPAKLNHNKKKNTKKQVQKMTNRDRNLNTLSALE